MAEEKGLWREYRDMLFPSRGTSLGRRSDCGSDKLSSNLSPGTPREEEKERKKMAMFESESGVDLVLTYREEKSGSIPSMKFSKTTRWEVEEILTDTILLSVTCQSGFRRMVIPRASLRSLAEIPYAKESQ